MITVRDWQPSLLEHLCSGCHACPPPPRQTCVCRESCRRALPAVAGREKACMSCCDRILTVTWSVGVLGACQRILAEAFALP